MAIMLSKTYAAFKASGASDLQAQEAAEELATYENRLAGIESDLKTIKRDLSEIQNGWSESWSDSFWCGYSDPSWSSRRIQYNPVT